MSVADGAEPLGRVRDLAEALRDAGVPVGTGRLVGLARAAAVVEPDDLYWAARATLISRREDVAAFDRAFASVFGLPERTEPPLPEPVPDRRQRVVAPSDLGAAAPDDGSSDTSLASPIETLRRTDFAGCSEDELAAPAGGGRPGPATPTSAGPSAARCAPAASPSSAPGGGAASSGGGSS